MSNINDIINRVTTDEEFRTKFLNDPIKTTEEYDLSKEEVAQLQAINMYEIQEINRELEERLSKSFVNMPDFAVEEQAAEHSNMVHANHDSHNNSDAILGW